jgi:hypothetical protein
MKTRVPPVVGSISMSHQGENRDCDQRRNGERESEARATVPSPRRRVAVERSRQKFMIFSRSTTHDASVEPSLPVTPGADERSRTPAWRTRHDGVHEVTCRGDIRSRHSAKCDDPGRPKLGVLIAVHVEWCIATMDSVREFGNERSRRAPRTVTIPWMDATLTLSLTVT